MYNIIIALPLIGFKLCYKRQYILNYSFENLIVIPVGWKDRVSQVLILMKKFEFYCVAFKFNYFKSVTP